MDTGSRSLLIAAVLIAIISAYLTLAGAAYERVSRAALRARHERGDARAERALAVLDGGERTAMAVLVGGDILNIAAAACAAVLALRMWGAPGLIPAAAVCALALYFLAGALPRCIARKYSERVAVATARAMRVLTVLLTPLTAAVTAAGSAASRLTKGDPEVSVTKDELYDIIEDMTDGGSLDAGRGELMSSALEFADLTVETVLTARVDIAAIDLEWEPERVLSFVREQRHSRLPVYEDSVDNIVGVLQIRRYLKAWLRTKGRVDLRSLLDEPYFVERSMKIDELLPLMSAKKLYMAIVTDGYGGTLGLVTVEDILEELVGEIWDEDDVVEESFVPLGGGRVEVSADLTVGDVLDRLDYEPDEPDEELEYKLMGEWAYEQFDRIPDVRDSFVWQRLEVSVSEMRENRIVKLVCRLLPAPEAEEGDK